MSATLESLREQWEQGILLFHKESLTSGCHVSIVEITTHGNKIFHIFRYLQTGDKWNVSCDGAYLHAHGTNGERCAWAKAMEYFS